MAVRLMKRKDCECAWPIEEPSARMKCCGDPVEVGPYCAAHAAIAYVRMPEKLEPSIQVKPAVSGLTIRRKAAVARPVMDAMGWA